MDIVSLLLGSALTILGGFVSNWQTSKLARAADIRQNRREKLEKLTSLTISTDDWLEKFQEDQFAFPQRHTRLEPMDHMYALSDLYFPELWHQVHEFCNTARELCHCIRKEAMRRLQEKSAIEQGHAADADAAKRALQEYGDEYLTIHKTVVVKQDVLIQSLRNVVQKLQA